MPANSIGVAKVNLSGIVLPAGSVTTASIAAGAVTTASIANGAVTDAKIAGIGLNKLPNAGANEVLAGPVAGAAGSPAYRALVAADLPSATTTGKGGVFVPAAGGLQVVNGALSINNSVAAATNPVVTYNAQGLITGGRALQGADLPVPTATDLGGVKPGTGITVTADGTLSQSDTAVVPGTYTKVTTDQQGNITAGAQLTAADIPNLDTGKITTGTFGEALIANGAITRDKLAGYALSYIQEATPPTVGVPIGVMWFQESTAGLHMWNGNSWMPISIGRLSQENLRYCGTVDATTGLVAGVTTFGTSAGYKIGDALKAATDAHTGVYFVITTPGNAIPEATGITFDNGDWILCNGAAAGWIRVDTLNAGGGGGGGGATNIGDLLDVSIGTPSAGDMLVYQASGQWRNITSLDEGTY